MKLSILSLLAALILASEISVAADDRLIAAAERIERQLEAKVGLAIHDTGTEDWWLHNADERFPMASTFKVLACAALLSSDLPDAPTTVIHSLEEYSPVTESMLGRSVSPYAMCDATMRTSDNTAANLVLEALGGPASVTQFVRTLGDDTTRLDRWEPDLNEGAAGDVRDTTTPRAIAKTLQSVVLGDGLPAAERAVLTHWLRSNEVGGPLLRAGVPPEWAVADRTGAGGNGTRGVVAVLWPDGSAPLVAAIFLTDTSASMDNRNAAIAELGRVLAETVSER